jgi:hypothetical protein
LRRNFAAIACVGKNSSTECLTQSAIDVVALVQPSAINATFNIAARFNIVTTLNEACLAIFVTASSVGKLTLNLELLWMTKLQDVLTHGVRLAIITATLVSFWASTVCLAKVDATIDQIALIANAGIVDTT